jgi:hypothetical protein
VSPAPPPPNRAIPPQSVRVPQPTLIAPRIQQPQPQPVPRPAGPVYRPRPRPNIFLRSIKLAIITAILIAVPTAVAYLTFHYAQDTPAWPINLRW